MAERRIVGQKDWSEGLGGKGRTPRLLSGRVIREAAWGNFRPGYPSFEGDSITSGHSVERRDGGG